MCMLSVAAAAELRPMHLLRVPTSTSWELKAAESKFRDCNAPHEPDSWQ